MKFSAFFALLTLFILLIAGCRDDMDLTITETELEPPVTTEGTFSVGGIVTRRNGNALANATVELIGTGLVTVTTSDGRYNFSNAPLPVDGVAMTVTHASIFPEHRFFKTQSGSSHRLDVATFAANPNGVVFGEEGGTVTIDGASLTINPASTLLDGQPYSGRINISMRYEDPNEPVEMRESAGNAPGKHPVRDRVALESYGMVQLQLTSQDNQILTIDSSSPARINFPSGPIEQFMPEDSVLFWSHEPDGWHFTTNNSTANEGMIEADILGGGYFQFASPSPPTEFCGRLTDPAGTPLQGIFFNLQLEQGGPIYSFRTDEAGRFCALVPENQTLLLSFTDPCSGLDITSEIGPFSGEDSNIGDITVEISIITRPLVLSTCFGEFPSLNRFGVYINGRPDGGSIVYDAAGNLLLVTPNCDGAEEQDIQITFSADRYTSRVFNRNSSDLTPIVASVCSRLDEDEYFFHDLPENEIDSSFTHGGYLMNRDNNDELRHNFFGTLDLGQQELVVTVDMSFPFRDGDVFSDPEAEIAMQISSVSSATRYVCTELCDELQINVEEIGPNFSYIRGSYFYIADAFSLDQQTTLETDIELAGTFRFNR